MTTTEMRLATEAAEPRRVPGQPDMWVFVLVEALIFTSYFGVYLFSRTQHEQAFLQSQSHLILWLGVLDTIVLLTSSWSVARCVQHSRAGRYREAKHAALLTTGLGLLFLVQKIFEWTALIHRGHTFTSSEFFQHFFFLTGMHCLHLLIGFFVLGLLYLQLADPRKRSQETVETCATYWHTVDFLWVLIFALLYVVR